MRVKLRELKEIGSNKNSRPPIIPDEPPAAVDRDGPIDPVEEQPADVKLPSLAECKDGLTNIAFTIMTHPAADTSTLEWLKQFGEMLIELTRTGGLKELARDGDQYL